MKPDGCVGPGDHNSSSNQGPSSSRGTRLPQTQGGRGWGYRGECPATHSMQVGQDPPCSPAARAGVLARTLLNVADLGQRGRWGLAQSGRGWLGSPSS